MWQCTWLHSNGDNCIVFETFTASIVDFMAANIRLQDLKWEVRVHFVDICWSDDRHCFKFIFIMRALLVLQRINNKYNIIWIRQRVSKKTMLNLPPSNLQLMPWNFQIQCNYPLILVFANDIKKYTPIVFFETRWRIQIILYFSHEIDNWCRESFKYNTVVSIRM
jgi:hypothetical protein